jgi:hypothetical protein
MQFYVIHGSSLIDLDLLSYGLFGFRPALSRKENTALRVSGRKYIGAPYKPLAGQLAFWVSSVKAD